MQSEVLHFSTNTNRVLATVTQSQTVDAFLPSGNVPLMKVSIAKTQRYLSSQAWHPLHSDFCLFFSCSFGGFLGGIG